MDNPYDDIIDLPHHVSKTRPQMPMSSRAAQFAPFAALTGHAAALRETARATEQMVQLSSDATDILSRKMNLLIEKIGEEPTIRVTFFRPDDRKEGGAYLKTTGIVKKIMTYEQILELLTIDGLRAIPFRFIIDIEGDIFDTTE